MLARTAVVRLHELAKRDRFVAECERGLLEDVVAVAELGGDCGTKAKVSHGPRSETEETQRTLLELPRLLLLLLPALARRNPVALEELLALDRVLVVVLRRLLSLLLLRGRLGRRSRALLPPALALRRRRRRAVFRHRGRRRAGSDRRLALLALALTARDRRTNVKVVDCLGLDGNVERLDREGVALGVGGAGGNHSGALLLELREERSGRGGTDADV